jgi:hypothetical protein
MLLLLTTLMASLTTCLSLNQRRAKATRSWSILFSVRSNDSLYSKLRLRDRTTLFKHKEICLLKCKDLLVWLFQICKDKRLTSSRNKLTITISSRCSASLCSSSNLHRMTLCSNKRNKSMRIQCVKSEENSVTSTHLRELWIQLLS